MLKNLLPLSPGRGPSTWTVALSTAGAENCSARALLPPKMRTQMLKEYASWCGILFMAKLLVESGNAPKMPANEQVGPPFEGPDAQ